MTCTGCSRPLPPGLSFCPSCGAPAPAVCSHCGSEIAPGFKFCPRCGTPAAGSKSGTGERRVVTVLFADVAGFTALSERHDAELVTALMSRFFRLVGERVADYEGRVDKYIGDAAMVLFGAPIGHEDDPERAILTARAILEGLPALRTTFRDELGFAEGLDIHIGIATGLVVAGDVGSAGANYTVMGDAVNLAARLVDLAGPGEILISEATRRLVRGRIATERAGAARVKGKAQPVVIHRVVGAEPSAGDPRGLAELEARLIGRGRELEALRLAAASLAGRSGGFIFLRGPAGIGKSRLFRELIEAVGETVGVHYGRSISYGQSVPFYPWSQIVRALLAEAATRENSVASSALDDLAALAFGPRAQAAAERHRQELIEAVLGLVERSCLAMPRILCLEDMHWADPSSFELLNRLRELTRRAPLLVVILARADARTDAALLAGRDLRLDLAPLAPAEARSLVDELVRRVDGLDDRTRADVATKSDGIPLYVEEILRSWIDDGVLVASGERFRFDAEAAQRATLPSTLQAIIAARLDRLPTGDRERLELASVLGPEFDPVLVDRLLGRDVDWRGWASLEEQGEIVASVADDAALRYRFHRALTRDVLYETLLRARRQELHGLVADELERQKSPRAAELAWHLEQAGRKPRAAPLWWRAAQQAAGVFSNSEALELFARALAAGPTPGDSWAIRRERADLLVWLGRGAEAAAELESVAAECRAAGAAAEEADACSARAYTAYRLSDGAGILTWAERAQAAARRSGQPKPLARALRQLGIAHEFAGRFVPAEAAYRELIACDPERGGNALVARTYNSLGEIARANGRYAEALEYYEEFRRELGEGGIEHLLTYGNNSAAALLGLGRIEEALERIERVIAEKRRTGYESFLSESLGYRGQARLQLGRHDEALADALEAIRLADRQGEAEMVALALRLRARIRRAAASENLLALGGSAESDLRESARILGDIGKRREQATSLDELAAVLASEGEVGEAERIRTEVAAIRGQLEGG